MGPDGVLPSVLRELAKMPTEPLAVIYQQPWLTEEVSIDCRLANDSHLPSEGPEGESEELQACQSDLDDLRVLQQIFLIAEDF